MIKMSRLTIMQKKDKINKKTKNKAVYNLKKYSYFEWRWLLKK